MRVDVNITSGQYFREHGINGMFTSEIKRE